MSDDTGHVLASIEGALADWETSPDAMRWTADPDVEGEDWYPTESGPRFTGADWWWEVVDEVTLMPGPLPEGWQTYEQSLILHPADYAAMAAAVSDRPLPVPLELLPDRPAVTDALRRAGRHTTIPDHLTNT